MNSGQRISLLREKRGWSQAQLAKKLNVGTSTVGMWETNQRSPKREQIIAIAKLFDVSTDYILAYDSQNDAPDWATEQDKIDLQEFLSDNNVHMTFGGVDLTPEMKKKMDAVLTGVFWEEIEQEKKNKKG